MDRDQDQEDARQAGERLVAAHASEDPFAAAFKATRMPMIITDPNQHDNPIIFCNGAFERLTGYSSDELIGRNCRILQGPETSRDTVAVVRDAVAGGRSVSVDILNYKKDGSAFWNALFINPVWDRQGQITYFFASQLDFTNIKSREADLASARHQAEEEVKDRTNDLRAALTAKTLLIHEVDHRVRNNLLTMASIVKMQLRLTKDQGQQDALMAVLNRIEAISIVQRKLFTTNDVTRFDLGDFAYELVLDLLGAMKRDDIRLTLDISPAYVPALKASPLSLILNELIGDALSRGIRDSGGDIHVVIKQFNERLLIRVEDISEPIIPDEMSAELSRLLLERSALQVGATIERKCEERHTTVDVTLRVES
ncbi:two-component sensor histidine kinase protein (plasmid) [Rhizobium tropici CIAT 899]|nr:two-component sensor histidine kinase protein [Rhizobium tropici CIAT 899]MBB5595860.1 PAS domain S-box-containing protein [Rhizobium tropici]MBB6493852.1 PAS domain S-box-containing protein [Rhizobium tropici]